MHSGNAIQSTPSNAVPRQSAREIGPRAAGIIDRVMNPMAMRMKATPNAPTDSSPSAMKRNDVPQITPGPSRSSQSNRLVRMFSVAGIGPV
jgi:hypothetical protein